MSKAAKHMPGRARNKRSGRYEYDGNWDRLCVCGHRLGDHLAGGHDCVVGERDLAGTVKCDCPRFYLAALAAARGGK